MSWDDGKHAKVKRVQLTFDDVIRSIKVEYDGTALQSHLRGSVGTNSVDFTLSPDEYMTELTGYYRTTFSGEVITALTFKTNKKTYGPYGNKTRHYFSADAPSGNQIAGFLGTSGNSLNSIAIHIAPIPPPSSIGGNTSNTGGSAGGTGGNTGGATGGNTGGVAGDNTGGGAGGNTAGGTGEGTGGTTGGGTGGATGGGTGGTTGGGAGGNTGGGAGGITGGGTGGTTGEGAGGNTGGGTGGNTGGATGGNTGGATGGNTGGATGGSTGGATGGNTGGATGGNTGGAAGGNTGGAAGTNTGGAMGGNTGEDAGGAAGGNTGGAAGTNTGGAMGGNTGEDAGGAAGGNTGGAAGTNTGGAAGTNTGGATGGNTGEDAGGAAGGNTGESAGTNTGGPAGGNTGGHADETSSGSNTNSNPQKVEAQGGKGGNKWDDGADHDGVTNIQIAPGGLGIETIKFDYIKNGQPKEGPIHGVKGRAFIQTFTIDHPNEYLISVNGWYTTTNTIQGIQFKTNKRSSEFYGYEEIDQDGKEFSVEVKDKKIIGFHGFAGARLNSIGAYFAPIITSTPLKPAKKLQARGGNGGATWDDGEFDGVRKIYVGQGTDGVAFVMFEYNKGSQVVKGDGRGKKTLLGTETFELDYPSEYITSVEGYYDKVYGIEAELLISLTFKTNKRTSPPFGMTGGEHFELKEDGNKIVGFHGKAGDYVHQVGVYVAPITK